MFERISDGLRLFFLRTDEWVGGLSSVGRGLLMVALVAVIILAGYYGLIPSKRPQHNNPHALINW